MQDVAAASETVAVDHLSAHSAGDLTVLIAHGETGAPVTLVLSHELLDQLHRDLTSILF